MKQIITLGLILGCSLATLLFAAPARAAVSSCVGGIATEVVDNETVSYECSRVDLLSHMTIADLGGSSLQHNATMGIWGWTDSVSGKHYAIVGLYCRTAFVDVTNPLDPVLVGTLPAATDLDVVSSNDCTQAIQNGAGVFRDIEVENNQAYIVSSHPGSGLQVFDLTQLQGLAQVDYPYTFGASDSTAVGNFNAASVYTYIGNNSSFAVVAGATSGTVGPPNGGNVCAGTDAGGPLFYNIDTTVPQFVGKFCADGFTQDIECVDYSGPDTEHTNKEICFASNQDSLTIFDASNKASFSAADILSIAIYQFSGFTFQGSLDNQQKYFYLGDNGDETTYGLPTRTLVWDVSNLDAPVLITEYLAPVDAVDHYQFVHGDYLYQSNYTVGLHILDIHTRDAPYQKAFFDTFTENNSTVFHGSWSNYQFLNGAIGVTDIAGGLFLLQPTFDDGATAELAVAVEASVSEVVLQTPFTYTVSVVNNGPAMAENVFLTLRLSDGGVFDSTSTDTDCDAVSQTLMKCRIGNLASGQLAEFTVRAAGFSDSAITAIAMASAKQLDVQGANNTAVMAVGLKVAAPSDGGGAVSLWLLTGLLGMMWFAHRKRSA